MADQRALEDVARSLAAPMTSRDAFANELKSGGINILALSYIERDARSVLADCRRIREIMAQAELESR